MYPCASPPACARAWRSTTSPQPGACMGARARAAALLRCGRLLRDQGDRRRQQRRTLLHADGLLVGNRCAAGRAAPRAAARDERAVVRRRGMRVGKARSRRDVDREERVARSAQATACELHSRLDDPRSAWARAAAPAPCCRAAEVRAQRARVRADLLVCRAAPGRGAAAARASAELSPAHSQPPQQPIDTSQRGRFSIRPQKAPFCRRFVKGERGDSNPRPPGPQPGALPTELRPPWETGV